MTRKTRMITNMLLASCLIGLTVTKVFAESGQNRFPVTEEMLVRAMRYRQLPVEGVEVRLSAPITSPSANPMLEIQSMSLSGAHTAQLRVACRNRNECLPFYVAATWPAGSGTPVLPKGFSPHAKAEALDRLRQSSEVDARQDITVGSTATLIFEDGKMRISLRVVCLEAGVPGDKIRVATLDRKQGFKAQIISPGLLKGSF